jgi:hypothetical protein
VNPQDVGPAAADEAPWLVGLLRGIGRWVWEDHKSELFYAAAAVVWSVVRAMGKTVESGQTGLQFSFGRAVRVVEPGFHPLIPFLQVIRVLPTRSRTLDLAAQRVVTDEGLVYEADANLVYRVVDVRRALIELELSRRMAVRLEPWGVAVERAGFPSLRPSPATLRVTQLANLCTVRRQALGRLVDAGAPLHSALGLLSPAPRMHSRTRALLERARGRRAVRRRAWLLRQAADEARRRFGRTLARENVFVRYARKKRERQRERAAGRA